MTFHSYIEIAVFFVLLIFISPFLAAYMESVLSDNSKKRKIERWVFQIIGPDSNKEMNWKEYALAILSFHFLGFILLVAIQIGKARSGRGTGNEIDIALRMRQ
jgi:K+-transporting ATPase ATPase A chain